MLPQRGDWTLLLLPSQGVQRATMDEGGRTRSGSFDDIGLRVSSKAPTGRNTLAQGNALGLEFGQ